MPKQVFTLNDFSGGLNTAVDERDLSPNELTVCSCLDIRHRGKLTIPKRFIHYNATIPDNGPSLINGHGLFVFTNDYKLSDNSANYTGYFIAQDDGHGNLDIFESTGGWNINALVTVFDTATLSTPAFMSAEGDLFVSGSIVKTPKSLVFIHRFDFPGLTQAREVKTWQSLTQDKPAPDADTQQLLWESDSSHSTNAQFQESDASYDDDEIIWLIEWGGANSGTWENDGDKGGDPYIQFASSWLYKNQAESALYEFTTPEYDGDNLDASSKNAEDRAIKVWATIKSLSVKNYERSGSRLYARMSTESEWYMLAEVDYEKGIVGDGETEFNAWENNKVGTDGATAIATLACATSLIANPPSVYSYYANNGYMPSDIPTNNRKVQWKCGVIANSSAYIANVVMNGRYFGDRIFKSPPFQYDTFTENLWLESTTNDGDQIVDMRTFADRILVFREKSMTIINISQVDEYVEGEKKGAGIVASSAVAESEFGIIWANKNGCWLYNGEKIISLLSPQGKEGQREKIDTETWSDFIGNPIVGYDPKTKQAIIVGDWADATDAYVFSFENQAWYVINDTLGIDGSAYRFSNMINLPSGDLIVKGGGTSNQRYSIFTDRTTDTTISLETAELNFGNYESKKNLNKISITYTGHNTALNFYMATDGGSYTALSSYIESGSLSGSGRHVVVFNLVGEALASGKKTFKFKLSGAAGKDFEVEDLNFIIRDLGVR